MSYEPSGIKDYITLQFHAATVTEPGFARTYDIPINSYLNHNGSEYCLVSCENLDLVFGSNKRPFILTIEGVCNSYDTGNPSSESSSASTNIANIREGSIIAAAAAPNRATGSVSASGNKYAHRFTKNNVEYKMRARPGQIKIHTYNFNTAGRTIVKNCTGSFTLCFEYLSRKKVLDQELASSYTPAF